VVRHESGGFEHPRVVQHEGGFVLVGAKAAVRLVGLRVCHRRGPSFVVTGPYSLSSGRGSSFVVWSSFAEGPTRSRCATRAWSLGLRFVRCSLLVFGLGGGVSVVVHYAGGLWDGMSGEWRRTTTNGVARVFMTHLMGLPLLGPPFHFSPSPTLPLEKYKPAHIPLERGGAYGCGRFCASRGVVD